MFCAKCGHVSADSARFCTSCGDSLLVQADSGEALGQGAGSLPAATWRGGEVVLGILLVGVAFLFISATTLLLDTLTHLPHGLAWGAWIGSHAIGVVILAAVWLLGNKDGQLPLAALGLVCPRTSWLMSVLLAGAALGASLGFTALYAWLVTLLDVSILMPPEVPRGILFPGIYSLFSLEALALWTPFTEEIFFRGFIFAGLVPRMGVWRSGLVSALIFALFHLHPGVILPIIVTGLLLAALYRLTGSLWPPVMAHAGQNGIALVAVMYEV